MFRVMHRSYRENADLVAIVAYFGVTVCFDLSTWKSCDLDSSLLRTSLRV
jgi:hypothetical protein